MSMNKAQTVMNELLDAACPMSIDDGSCPITETYFIELHCNYFLITAYVDQETKNYVVTKMIDCDSDGRPLYLA